MALPKYDELYGDVLRWLGEHGEQSRAQLRWPLPRRLPMCW